MTVLVACEESQTVCKAFRALGHEAYSCDIQEPSGGHPEWHILGDALKAIDGGQVTTMDGQTRNVSEWDLLIAPRTAQRPFPASPEPWQSNGEGELSRRRKRHDNRTDCKVAAILQRRRGV